MWLNSSNARGNLPFPLSEGTFRIGRSAECQIIVLDPTVSRVHARLTFLKNQAIWIEDLGSRNGVLVNGADVSRRQLRPGVSFSLGNASLQLSLQPQFLEGSPAVLTEETQCSAIPQANLPDPAQLLTTKQYEIFLLLLRGLLPKEIGLTLGRDYQAVYYHVQMIYRIFDVHSQPGLMAKILRTK